MQKKVIIKLISAALLLSMVSMFSGCVGHQYQSSSVVQYLYPDAKEPIETPTIPRLKLPLKVGIAFVPASDVKGRIFTMHSNIRGGIGTFTEKDKISLMNNISNHFKKHEFIQSIEVIPSAYLRPEGSFTNLDQIRTMYGVDIIALISFDQHQFVDEDTASLSYWTIIGAYIVPGEKNDTHTMLDIAVYDIASRKMLFRAPGLSHIKSEATPVNITEALKKDSDEGFKQASEDLIINLDIQLQQFKEKVKQNTKEYNITNRPGYTGGGSVDTFFLLFTIIASGGYGLWRNLHKKG